VERRGLSPDPTSERLASGTRASGSDVLPGEAQPPPAAASRSSWLTGRSRTVG
jgi:hypothetical protein